MKAIGNIFLVWRPGRGNRRFPVGVIKRNVNEGISFRYDTIVVAKAKEYGFVHYEGFPEISKVYHENVIENFGQRIIQSERNDTKDFYDFWGVDSRFINDKYYMLAYTQGLLPTDNYEFLADFNPIKGLSFITEITGLSHNQIPCDIIQVGDKLNYVLDKKNKFDKDAVIVLKNNIELGYIKAIHCKVFGKSKNHITVSVARIEKNEFLNRVFLKIEVR